MSFRTESRGSLGRAVAGALAAVVLAALVAIHPAAPAAADAGDGDRGDDKVSTKGTVGQGYLFVATDGGIFNFGDSEFFGSTGDIRLNRPVVDAAYTPTGEGYWLVASDGGIFAFGDAEFFGSTGDIALNSPIVGMTTTPTGLGYWLVATDGGIFAFGDAEFFGSTGDIRLNQPIVAMDRTPSGQGYYLVAEDGGIFAFGDAQFYGSTGAMRLNQPIVGMEALDDGQGYYLVATDGGIFAFGRTADDAQFFGSTGDIRLNQPIVDMALTGSNQGYWLVAADGGIFAFGDAPFLGSTGDIALNKPVVGIDRTPNSPLTAPDFVANLRGEAEVPGPGDPDASGFAFLDFTNDEICYSIQTNNVAQITAAHIHEAPAGVAGPVFIALESLPNEDGAVEACQDADPAKIAQILENPAGYYLNFHNAEFPGGAVRGQLEGETVYATTGTNELLAFNTEFPSFVTDPVRISGTGGETIVGIDYRPADDRLYALTVPSPAGGRIYVIDDVTGAASHVGDFAHDFTGASAFGFDVDPLADRIRIVSNANDNLEVDPDTGALADADADLTGTGDGNPDVVGIAYTRNVDQGALEPTQRGTSLFGIDGDEDSLVEITDPETGAVVVRGGLGVDAGELVGFDIAPAPADDDGTAIAVFRAAGGAGPEVYALNLHRTDFGNVVGKATLLGMVGTGERVITAITIA